MSRHVPNNSTAMYAINKAINKEKDYRAGVNKIHASAMVLADTLAVSGAIEKALFDVTTSESDLVQGGSAGGNEEKQQYELFLNEQRERLKMLTERNIENMRHVDAFIDAASFVKEEILRESNKDTEEKNEEDEEEDEEDPPNYEDMILNKVEENKKVRARNALDIQHESMMRKCKERLGENNNDKEDEELEIMNQPGMDTETSLKCPITQMLFEKPVRNKICHHVFEYEGIKQHLRSKRHCPMVGCTNQSMTLDQLEEDEEMRMRVRRFKVRSEKRQKLNEDCDEVESNDEAEANFGTTVID